MITIKRVGSDDSERQDVRTRITHISFDLERTVSARYNTPREERLSRGSGMPHPKVTGSGVSNLWSPVPSPTRMTHSDQILRITEINFFF